MKKNNQLLGLLSLALLLSGAMMGQATHVVTLHVDTNTISNPNPSASCYFSVSEGTNILDNNSPEAFTIYADVGDTIIWQGVSSVSDDPVNIKMIKYSNGPRIFSEDDIPGDNSVQAIVVRDTRNQDDYKYQIFFDVIRSGARFQIDPKIKVGQ